MVPFSFGPITSVYHPFLDTPTGSILPDWAWSMCGCDPWYFIPSPKANGLIVSGRCWAFSKVTKTPFFSVSIIVTIKMLFFNMLRGLYVLTYNMPNIKQYCIVSMYMHISNGNIVLSFKYPEAPEEATTSRNMSSWIPILSKPILYYLSKLQRHPALIV